MPHLLYAHHYTRVTVCKTLYVFDFFEIYVCIHITHTIAKRFKFDTLSTTLQPYYMYCLGLVFLSQN